MSDSKANKRDSNSTPSFLGFNSPTQQQKNNPTPIIEYKVLDGVESTALETVFNYLFELVEKELKP